VALLTLAVRERSDGQEIRTREESYAIRKIEPLSGEKLLVDIREAGGLYA
jgi:hypothetical protein